MLLFVSKRARLFLAGLSLGVVTLRAADEVPPPSPFLPPADRAAQAAPDSSSGYEFVGVTATAAQTLVSIRRVSDQRSVWIPVGQTLAEITVVNYDSTKDEVVLRTAAAPFTLRLRDHGSSAATASAPDTARLLPAPAATSPASAPITVPSAPLSAREQKEFEARMLVTDLLEIGQQQRKAYEEARRRDAAAKATPAPTASAPASQSPPKPVAPAPRAGEAH